MKNMSAEHFGLENGQTRSGQREVILAEGTEVVAESSSERVSSVEWVRFVEEEFYSSEAPFKRAIKELLARHPEESKLLAEIESSIYNSASRASGMARKLAGINLEEWRKAVQEGGI
jgi:hypothetical protein